MRRRRDNERKPVYAFVIGSANIGGAERQLVRLVCELRKRGHDARMIFQVPGGPLTADLDAAGVPWVTARVLWLPTSKGRNVFAILRMGYVLWRWRPTVVTAWLATAIWPAVLWATVVTKAVRIAGFRGEVFDGDLRWQAPLFRFAVRHSDIVTVNSPTLLAEAERWGAPREAIRLLVNGVDLPDHAVDVTSDDPIGIFVANFRAYKGHDVLVEAIAQTSTHPRIVLCGEGENRGPIMVAADRAGVADRFIFIDVPADVPAELSRSHFAVHPSTTEGLSNAILEEMAHGLPVVATDVGGTSLLVLDGETGYLVESGDVSALASAIDKIASDAQLRRHLGEAARRHATTFSWPASVDAYEALLLTGRRRGRS